MDNNQPNQVQSQPVQNRNMNVKMNNWSLRKKILALGAVVLLILGVVVTIVLVQRQQELRSRAEKSTTLSLSPASQKVSMGDDAKLDLVVNPGVNQVNFVKVHLVISPDNFTAGTFELNSSTGFSIIEDPVYDDETGILSFAIGVGPDPTKVIQSTVKLGTVILTTNGGVPASVQDVTFGPDTQVRSVGSGDAFNENVLQNTVPAQISIGISAPICKPNVGTCSWDAVPNATKYKYEVISSDGNTVIAADETSNTSVEFPVDTTPGTSFTYTCSVTAVNECGESNPAENSAECAVPSVTPTPTVTLTPTPTVTPTPTEETTPTPTEPDEEVTPTDAPEDEATPTPTEITVVTQPPAQGGSEGVITATPTPTIPAPGNPVVYGGIIGGVLFLIGGLALLLL